MGCGASLVHGIIQTYPLSQDGFSFIFDFYPNYNSLVVNIIDTILENLQ